MKFKYVIKKKTPKKRQLLGGCFLYQALEIKLNKKTNASANTSRLLFKYVISFTPFLFMGCEQSTKQKKILIPIPVYHFGTGNASCFLFFALSKEGRAFKKRRRSVLFWKVRPSARERSGKSRTKKRRGMLQACRNLGRPLFCSYYP